MTVLPNYYIKGIFFFEGEKLENYLMVIKGTHQEQILQTSYSS